MCSQNRITTSSFKTYLELLESYKKALEPWAAEGCPFQSQNPPELQAACYVSTSRDLDKRDREG
jgi:hypothetical protein